MTQEEPRIRVYDMQSAPLGNLPFHGDCSFITRWAPADFPLHMGVHVIDPLTAPPEAYAQLHSHDCPEMNMLFSPQGELVYKMQTRDEEIIVNAPGCIWIPAGVAHAASVVKGSGIFVAVLLTDHYQGRAE
jgi:hypothetical protein